MNPRAHTVDIDSIVLDGLDIRPERAERLRALLEVNLEKLLAHGGALGQLSAAQADVLGALTSDMLVNRSDPQLAAALAHQIARSLGAGEPYVTGAAVAGSTERGGD